MRDELKMFADIIRSEVPHQRAAALGLIEGIYNTEKDAEEALRRIGVVLKALEIANKGGKSDEAKGAGR